MPDEVPVVADSPPGLRWHRWRRRVRLPSRASAIRRFMVGQAVARLERPLDLDLEGWPRPPLSITLERTLALNDSTSRPARPDAHRPVLQVGIRMSPLDGSRHRLRVLRPKKDAGPPIVSGTAAAP